MSKSKALNAPGTSTNRDFHTVTVMPAGWTFPSSTDQTLAQAARQVGIHLPLSCQNGTCRTCLCLATDGAVRYGIEWPGLSAEEKSEGWILPCVAVPVSDLIVEVPHAWRDEPA